MSTQAQRQGKKAMPFSKAHQIMKKDGKALGAFITKVMNDWVINLACLIAYNMLMAMLPIALALLAILGVFLGNSSTRTSILHQITVVFPGLANQQNVLELASKQLGQASSILGVAAVISAVLFGSFLFVVMEGCLDIVYRVRPRPIVRQFLVAIGMIVVFVILIPIMVFASTAPAIVFSSLSNLPLLKSIPGGSFIFVSLGGILGGFIASFILFEVIYLVIPNQRTSWRNSWRGAVFAAVFTEIFLAAFPLIITHFLSGYAGTIGFAVILLLFFYFFSIILLLGAEINAFFFEGVRPVPNDIVTFLSTMAGKLNKDVPEAESSVHVDSKLTEQADAAHIAEACGQEGHTH